jgi:mannose-1-phosphate guanylyltransferase
MATTSNHYILILCGGTGPRLWPLSRAYHPKPFLKLFSQNSLLKETFLRAQKIVSSDHIFIITHQKYLHLVSADLKDLALKDNIITEPEKKNTALAILYASTIISQKDPQAIITTFTSDHFIGKMPSFIKTIKTAASLAVSRSSIVTIGIKPTSPSTSYGYLLTGTHQKNFYLVRSFIEKPPLDTAQDLIKTKHSLWNSGIYTFSTKTIFAQFQKYAPRFYSFYRTLCQTPKPSDISNVYHNSQNQSIDIAISEKSQELIVIPANFDWSDIGEWKSIYQKLAIHRKNIVSLNQSSDFISINSGKCLISGQKDKIIGLIGVNNLAVIDTPDGLLVCNIANNDSYSVRDLVSQIVSRPKFKKYFLSDNDQ